MQVIQNAVAGIPMVEQFFMNPLGLLAVLAIIPLLVFYLMKPKPEEKVMPSMRFFQEEKKDDTLRKAYRKLITNLPLILQLLAVLGFAAALANPYILIQKPSENTVLVLDRSASVSENFNSLKQKLEARAGEKNTLIVADNEVKVLAEKAPSSTIKSILERMKPVHTETDIVSAIQLAQNYRGKLVVASDLDQTADQRNAIENLAQQADRPTEIIHSGTTNKWGITEVEPGKNSTAIEISNFQDNPATIRAETPAGTRELAIASGSAAVIRVESEKGRNTVKLPEDRLRADNKAYFYIPDRKTIKISYHGPVNRYLDKAIDLAEGMHVNYTSTRNTDVYFIASDLNGQKVQEIRQKVSSGGAAVIFPQSEATSTVFNLNTSRKVRNASLRINKPVRVSLGEVKLLDRNIEKGESLSNPSYALKKIKYGEGTLLTYNIMQSDFQTNFVYPIFWRDVINEIVDRPSISQLNRKTGDSLTAEKVKAPEGERFSGDVELNKTGFYQVGNKVYAVNLESPDESDINSRKYSADRKSGTVKVKHGMQSWITLVVVLLVGADLLYLWYRGDL
ncbi:MAG: BatA and WFA domain-containing protein [Candidatus Nanosalina sp.]